MAATRAKAGASGRKSTTKTARGAAANRKATTRSKARSASR
jgi:hypothetical protein